MRLRIATAFALLFFVALAGILIRISGVMPTVEPPPPPPPPFAFDPSAVSGEQAFLILEGLLEISPRDSGTKGAKRAAEFISGSLRDAGLTPNVDEFDNVTPEGDVTFRNVTSTVKGSGKTCIVLISHYDTKSGMPKQFTGANDSGSSTALLLHLASVMRQSTNTNPDIVFAFVDGEEAMDSYSQIDGLHGSRRLLGKLQADYGANNILCAVVLDMIGDKDLSLTIPRNSTPPLIQRLFDAAHAEGAREAFSLYGPMLDDHAPFINAEIPAVDIIDFEYGSVPGQNDYWHTGNDNIENVSPESIKTVGRITVHLLNSLIKEPLAK